MCEMFRLRRERYVFSRRLCLTQIASTRKLAIDCCKPVDGSEPLVIEKFAVLASSLLSGVFSLPVYTFSL